MNGVGPPASSVSASRALLLPEASDFEDSTTSYDTIFSNYYSSRTGSNPAAFLEQFFQESSGSAVTLVRYFLVLLRLRVQQ